MLAIRMRRMGSKKRASFRVVVSDSHAARDSRFVEVVGHYNPRTRPATVQLDKERIAYWTAKGAHLSDTVRTLMAHHVSAAAPEGGVAEAAPPAGDQPAL
jgi:small subunit ribosomal protein S16